MIQEAIETLSKLLSQFKNSYSLEIMADGSIILFYMEEIESEETFPKEFKNAVDMIVWMEDNLEKTNL